MTLVVAACAHRFPASSRLRGVRALVRPTLLFVAIDPEGPGVFVSNPLPLVLHVP